MGQPQERWGIILAAGEGNRVRHFLSALCGGRGIKQFCAVLGRRSLLQLTVDRVQRLIPRERILIIVDKRHEPETVEQLAGWPRENIIYQPANRETAPGILLPLAHVSHRCPNATVGIFPSDHFVLDERRFLAHLEKAFAEADLMPDHSILLGVKPDQLEDGYGWISAVKDPRGRASLAVRDFREKPSLAQARQLMSAGALWNTFILTSRAATLWQMTRQAVPDLYGVFSSIRIMLGTHQATRFIDQAYERMPTVNFSHAVLTPCAQRLRVLPVPEIGWSDWGSPERILGSALRMGRLHELAARIGERQVQDPSIMGLFSRFERQPETERSLYEEVA